MAEPAGRQDAAPRRPALRRRAAAQRDRQGAEARPARPVRGRPLTRRRFSTPRSGEPRRGSASMDYRPLGASGLKVSPLWLGTMMFGDQTDEAEAARIVAAARDGGVNAIDTANAYAGGESERITGRLIHADRDHWVLATKLANPTGPGPNDR